MPYALFCDDARISRAYPTEASVWKHARESGLVVDISTGEEGHGPRRVLDNGYEIRACEPEPPCDWRTLTLSLVFAFQYFWNSGL